MASKTKHYESGAVLLKDREVAALLGVGARFIHSMRATGRIPPPIRLSLRCVRWRKSDILRWLELDCPNAERFAQLQKVGAKP